MVCPLQVSLKACNPKRNLFRFYTLSLDRDLFKDWVVTSCYGRIGCRGTIRRKSYTSYKEAKGIYNRILKKRLNAKSRIGCNYFMENVSPYARCSL